jgi:hypothetical protein
MKKSYHYTHNSSTEEIQQMRYMLKCLFLSLRRQGYGTYIFNKHETELNF